MFLKHLIPVRVREIFTGKPVCSRVTEKSRDEYFRDLRHGMGANLGLTRDGDSFEVRYVHSFPYQKNRGILFRGEYVRGKEGSEVRGRFCYQTGEKVVPVIFLLMFSSIPFLCEDHLFGAVGGFFFLHFFGAGLDGMDYYMYQYQESLVLMALGMKHWREAGKAAAGE